MSRCLTRLMTRLMTRIEASLGRLAADLGGEAHVVGGAVRDRLLGIAVDEVDIVVDEAELWAQAAAERLGVRAARIGRGPEVWRLAVDGGTVDVVERVGSLRADLLRRDFTVNAMAVGLPEYVAGDFSRRSWTRWVGAPTWSIAVCGCARTARSRMTRCGRCGGFGWRRRGSCG